MSFISEEYEEKLKEQISDKKKEVCKEESSSECDTEIKESLDLLESGAKLIISAIKKLRRINEQ